MDPYAVVAVQGNDFHNTSGCKNEPMYRLSTLPYVLFYHSTIFCGLPHCPNPYVNSHTAHVSSYPGPGHTDHESELDPQQDKNFRATKQQERGCLVLFPRYLFLEESEFGTAL